MEGSWAALGSLWPAISSRRGCRLRFPCADNNSLGKKLSMEVGSAPSSLGGAPLAQGVTMVAKMMIVMVTILAVILPCAKVNGGFPAGDHTHIGNGLLLPGESHEYYNESKAHDSTGIAETCDILFNCKSESGQSGCDMASKGLHKNLVVFIPNDLQMLYEELEHGTMQKMIYSVLSSGSMAQDAQVTYITGRPGAITPLTNGNPYKRPVHIFSAYNACIMLSKSDGVNELIRHSINNTLAHPDLYGEDYPTSVMLSWYRLVNDFAIMSPFNYTDESLLGAIIKVYRSMTKNEPYDHSLSMNLPKELHRPLHDISDKSIALVFTNNDSYVKLISEDLKSFNPAPQNGTTDLTDFSIWSARGCNPNEPTEHCDMSTGIKVDRTMHGSIDFEGNPPFCISAKNLTAMCRYILDIFSMRFAFGAIGGNRTCTEHDCAHNPSRTRKVIIRSDNGHNPSPEQAILLRKTINLIEWTLHEDVKWRCNDTTSVAKLISNDMLDQGSPDKVIVVQQISGMDKKLHSNPDLGETYMLTPMLFGCPDLLPEDKKIEEYGNAVDKAMLKTCSIGQGCSHDKRLCPGFDKNSIAALYNSACDFGVEIEYGGGDNPPTTNSYCTNNFLNLYVNNDPSSEFHISKVLSRYDVAVAMHLGDECEYKKIPYDTVSLKYSKREKDYYLLSHNYGNGGMECRTYNSKVHTTSKCLDRLKSAMEYRNKVYSLSVSETIDPEPNPDVIPEPEPTPGPEPNPDVIPALESTPGLKPKSDVIPALEPTPGPEPNPDVIPALESTPGPEPNPDVIPALESTPGPKPKPDVIPALEPTPCPEPNPDVIPVPGPTPNNEGIGENGQYYAVAAGAVVAAFLLFAGGVSYKRKLASSKSKASAKMYNTMP